MKKRRERKLPIQQLSILSICRFAEPIASTSLFPYLPEMVRSFGIVENEVGKWAGFLAAIFSLTQAIFAVPWGRYSDTYGRKPAILLGLSCTMVTTLWWGFSKTLSMALIARAIAGAGNGNVGIIRTTVAEMVPFKELQPRAFSLMPLVWNAGSIIGPTIGGALANPLNVEPGERIEHPSFLERFPYALPNLVTASFFAIGIMAGVFYLEETLETLEGRRDYGLVAGRYLTRFWKSQIVKLKKMFHFQNIQQRATPDNPDETSALLKTNGKSVDEEHDLHDLPTTEPQLPRPGFGEVLTKQAIINLIVYALLAMHAMGYDQLLPVYMAYPSIHSGSPHITPPGTNGNPLKFAGGFGLDSFTIGLVATTYGVVGVFIQFFVFPPVARRFGVLYCLKWCACAFPVAYFLMPFTALLPTRNSQIGGAFAVMILKCLCGIFAFPCSTIMITNSASSLRTLGTLNGFTTSVAAVGRALGPALGGAMFTFSVKRGYVIGAWWLFSALAVLAAIPVFWLVEGEGFGGDDDEVSDEEEEDIDDAELETQAIQGGAKAAGEPGPTTIPTRRRTEYEEEEDRERTDGEPSDLGFPLHRADTTSSAAIASETDSPEVSRRESTDDPRQEDPAPGRLTRRRSVRIMRRMSIPIGMGQQPISRRFSSNVGQTFGTTGSYQGG